VDRLTSTPFFSRAALLLLTIGVAALSIGSVRLDSATADEPAHIAAGYFKLVYGRMEFFREQQPLMNSISALPLVVSGFHRAPPPDDRPGDHWGVGKDYLFRSGHDSDRMLFLARLPTIALFLALCWVVYAVVARESGSRWWGVGAFALTGFCPTLMAHGRLATVDMAAALFLFASAVLLIRVIERPSWLTAIGLGATAGAAVMSKTSCLIFGLYAIAVVILAALQRKIEKPRKVAAMLIVALVVTVLFIEAVVLPLARDADVVRPFRDLAGNVEVIRDWYSSRFHFKLQFLNGRFSERGWPHYYLVALALKSTIPSLLLFFSAFGAALWLRRLSFVAAACLLFVVTFLAAAAAGQLALGVRYVLPILPFAYAFTAMILSGAKLSPLAGGAVTFAILWHLAANVAAWPSYISYFNPVIGDHRNADRYLIDSNLDWGQDLRRLDGWCRDRGVSRLFLDYFGGGDPATDLSMEVVEGWGPGRELLPPGWFAVSRHLYRASFFAGGNPITYDEYLRRSRARYVTTIGGSITVYRVE
jgi:hypothetical protein